MVIGLLATITILEGKNEEFESAFLDLTEKVRASEPGNVFYALHTCSTRYIKVAAIHRCAK